MHKGKIILFCILIGTTIIAPSACKNQKVSTITPTPILVPTVSMASTITTSEVWFDGNTEAYWYENPKGAVIITANGNQYVETIQTNNVSRL